MALVLKDRVRDTTTTAGTGTVTLSGTAPTGFQNFSAIGNGNTTYYTISGSNEWEVGIGTYSSTGPTLSRDTVLESSNAGALVPFSAGSKDVFVTLPAERVGVLYTPVKTSNYAAAVFDGVQTNTSGGAFTVTLPASPAVGDQVVVVDSANSWATNNLTIARNGSTIEGSASDLVCDISGVSVQLVYSGTTWDVFAQAGGAGGGLLSVPNGGTGASTLTANAVLVGNGTSPVTGVSPSTSGNVLTSNGTAWTSSALPATANLQEFTSSGTWTKPSGATFVMVECWGAGGGGASGARGAAGTNRSGGSGGGGGAYAYRVFKASDLGATESVTIGAGGTGGAARTTDGVGNAGTNGGDTSFGTKLKAFGGGGANATGTIPAGGGGGGVLSAAQFSIVGAPAVSGGGAFGGGATGSTDALPSGFGGGGGGDGTVGYPVAGACSYQGGGGGGGGGSISSGAVSANGFAGGYNVGRNGGGGTAGTSGASPTAGGDGTAIGMAGGGGGSGQNTGLGGAKGGTGGVAGGGGGGGAGATGYNSGAGGNGGNGFCRVYSW